LQERRASGAKVSCFPQSSIDVVANFCLASLDQMEDEASITLSTLNDELSSIEHEMNASPQTQDGVIPDDFDGPQRNYYNAGPKPKKVCFTAPSCRPNRLLALLVGPTTTRLTLPLLHPRPMLGRRPMPVVPRPSALLFPDAGTRTRAAIWVYDADAGDTAA
jgi:hypothetical protein